MKEFISPMPGMNWLSVLNPNDATIMSLMHQLEFTQWATPKYIQSHQRKQLAALVKHAKANVPFYRGIEFKDSIHTLPLLTRSQLQNNAEHIQTHYLYPEHLPIKLVRTSGSTGMPVEVAQTRITELIYRALNLRNHVWHERDLRASLAVIRLDEGNRARANQWSEVFKSGDVIDIPLNYSAERQLKVLRRSEPGYVLTYPSNLESLLNQTSNDEPWLQRLLGVSTFGEIVSPELRNKCKTIWGKRLSDIYSSKEVGVIAIQCPGFDHYHIQSESLIVEVLDDEDKQCLPGQTGRVVITDLHNFATPLIRYDIGDYATVGADCYCGRGLPVLLRIYGRKRNMMTLPSGYDVFPNFIINKWVLAFPSIRQVQVVQTAISKLSITLVMKVRVDEAKKSFIESFISLSFPEKFAITFQYLKPNQSIARSAGGKYEDFINAIS
jgi:phenylacetate-CoA ligase